MLDMENNSNQPANSSEDPIQSQPIPNAVNNQKSNFPIILGILLLLIVVAIGAYYLGAQNNKQPSQQPQAINSIPVPTTTNSKIKQSPTPTVDTKNGVTIKIVDGDIVITQNGMDTKITSWGYNSDPVLSPDGSKIAYISKSKESIENEKVDKGYKRTSTNVWVVNSDGSKPTQVTNHINFVYRSNLHWLDNNRLLFVDGEQTTRVYRSAQKTLQTVMGPEKAVQACLDACGYETRYFYSPDYSYLVRLSGGSAPAKTSIFNTQTLKSNEISKEFGINFDTVSFPNNLTLTFKGSELPNYEKQIEVTINLINQQVSIR